MPGDRIISLNLPAEVDGSSQYSERVKHRSSALDLHVSRFIPCSHTRITPFLRAKYIAHHAMAEKRVVEVSQGRRWLTS